MQAGGRGTTSLLRQGEALHATEHLGCATDTHALCHSWSSCRRAVPPRPRQEGVTPPVSPASRPALRKGLPSRRTVTTDIAHSRERSGYGYTLFGPPAANTGKFTVRAVAEIITLWPRQ